MRCLVTGGTGFIGSHLIRFLLDHGCGVGVLVRPESNIWRIRDMLGDIHAIRGSMPDVEEALPGIQAFSPEVVFHLAWAGVGGQHRDDAAQAAENLHGSLSILNMAHRVGCQVWIGLGSQAEYGPHEGLLTEDTPPRPVTAYGVGKLCTGLLAQRLCGQFCIRFAWLRLFAAYGPMDDDEHLIPYVTQSLLNGCPPCLTPAEQRWDYLFVKDVVRALWFVSVTPIAQGIFNLGSGEAQTIRSIAERIRDMIDPRLALRLGERPYDRRQVMHLQADITLLRETTGWRPTVPLEAGLRTTVDWYKRTRDSRSALSGKLDGRLPGNDGTTQRSTSARR